jgi:hypothetical protein
MLPLHVQEGRFGYEMNLLISSYMSSFFTKCPEPHLFLDINNLMSPRIFVLNAQNHTFA